MADLSWPRCPCCDGPASPEGAPSFSLEVDVATTNELNAHGNRMVHSRRRASIRETVHEAVSVAGAQGKAIPDRGPWLVHMTRLSPGELDDDAVPGSLKTVRDYIAAVLGVDDRDPRVTWTYGQAHRRELGVRVEVWSRAEVSS